MFSIERANKEGVFVRLTSKEVLTFHNEERLLDLFGLREVPRGFEEDAAVAALDHAMRLRAGVATMRGLASMLFDLMEETVLGLADNATDEEVENALVCQILNESRERAPLLPCQLVRTEAFADLLVGTLRLRRYYAQGKRPRVIEHVRDAISKLLGVETTIASVRNSIDDVRRNG